MSKPILVLTHGALGSSSDLLSLKSALEPLFDIHIFEFQGHGATSLQSSNFRITQFAQELNQFISLFSTPVNVFGYSMGGMVAVKAAMIKPEQFSKIICLGTKWKWDGGSAEKEASKLNAEFLKSKVPDFYNELAQKHTAIGADAMLNHTAEMMIDLGVNYPISTQELESYSTSTLLLLASGDKMVSQEETIDMRSKLKGAELGIIPMSKHPLPSVNEGVLLAVIRTFL